MSSRKKLRSSTRLALVQALYQIEISGHTSDQVAAQFLSYQKGAVGVDEQAREIDHQLFSQMLNKVQEDIESLDELVSNVLTKDWSMDRLGATMRALMRASCYELTNRMDVPARVVIKEYVDMARRFYDVEETGFVNAALDRLARSLRRAEMASVKSPGECSEDAKNS